MLINQMIILCWKSPLFEHTTNSHDLCPSIYFALFFAQNYGNYGKLYCESGLSASYDNLAN